MSFVIPFATIANFWSPRTSSGRLRRLFANSLRTAGRTLSSIEFRLCFGFPQMTFLDQREVSLGPFEKVPLASGVDQMKTFDFLLCVWVCTYSKWRFKRVCLSYSWGSANNKTLRDIMLSLLYRRWSTHTLAGVHAQHNGCSAAELINIHFHWIYTEF